MPKRKYDDVRLLVIFTFSYPYIYYFIRYHQKVALEVPIPEFKSVQGLVNPIEFITPNPHALWTKQSYNSFDISKRIEKDLVNI